MIAVNGIGLWAPGFPSLDAFRTGVPLADVTEPACTIANPRAKRGTSRLARMLGEVVQQAGTDAGADLSTVPTVYASAWGEIEVMVSLLGQIADGEVGLSPLRFKHSVHNSASGLVSIATGNRGFSTAIAGGKRTVERGLIEAIALVESGEHDSVILAIAEDELPRPLDRYARYDALAIGLCLARVAPGTGPSQPPRYGTLSLSRGPVSESPSASARPLPKKYAENPTAWALPVVDALVQKKPGTYAISGAERPWTVEVGA
jgi:hypothetical protein